MNRFWEGWLPGSGRGKLGRGAQATKVSSFLKNLLTKLTDLEAWLPGSGKGNLGRGGQATKVNSFLKHIYTK